MGSLQCAKFDHERPMGVGTGAPNSVKIAVFGGILAPREQENKLIQTKFGTSVG